MTTIMTIADLKYEDGFPANIDESKKIIVQIGSGHRQGVVLYTCKITGRQDRCYLGLELNRVYVEDIYIIKS